MKDILTNAIIFTSIKASDVNHFQQNVSQRIKKNFPHISEVELRAELFKQGQMIENFMPLQKSTFFCIKTKTVQQIELVILTTEQTLNFDPEQSLEANMFFILLCPSNMQTVEHLNILSRLTRLVRNDDFYITLAGAETPDALRSMLLSQTNQILAA